MAEDHRGRGPERNVDSRVLPAASLEGKSFLLVAKQAENASSGAKQAGCSGQSSELRLVSEDGMDMPAGLELVLRHGRRLRISQGVQELRAALAVIESGNK
jgi:hypothetical protein